MFNKSQLFACRTLTKCLQASYSAKLTPMQKIIMLCGAPGAGKGTFSRLLAQDFGYTQISTGDEIRKILHGSKKNSEFSPAFVNELHKYVKTGKLVPDNLIMEILNKRIQGPSGSKGVILDGFPRTVNQLKMFTQVFPIHLVVNIEQDHDYLMASILGRRTCMDCGMSYSAYPYYEHGYELDVMMPEVEGVCDHCGGEVKTREDDTKSIVESRLKEYSTKTRPFLDALKKNEEMISFEAKRGIRDYPQLQQIIVSKVALRGLFASYAKWKIFADILRKQQTLFELSK